MSGYTSIYIYKEKLFKEVIVHLFRLTVNVNISELKETKSIP